jgi:uncharacterized protein (DUF697 family)
LWRLRGTAECNDRIGGVVAENWAAAVASLLGVVVVDIFLGEAEGEVNRIRKQTVRVYSNVEKDEIQS